MSKNINYFGDGNENFGFLDDPIQALPGDPNAPTATEEAARAVADIRASLNDYDTSLEHSRRLQAASKLNQSATELLRAVINSVYSDEDDEDSNAEQ